ncbi:hypothetical protein BN1723_009856 [Verticillium longisporum]|uniref:Extracellular membrane protein CFEM domain-containing protein n=1 Tax=Verticillium longisporum TaxID=100787 RepID=A0A0G4KTE1_VERLO|nr:hypothetical protein BN1723_009856 [Verticillium longisporum]
MTRSQTSRFAALALLMASMASAQMSLTSFDPLSTTQNIPIACRLAYTAPIGGCRRSDFFQGALCSAECKAGIEAMQADIQSECGGVFAPIDTLLAQALLGNLPALLCPNGGGNTVSSTSSTIRVLPTSTTRSLVPIITTPSLIPTPSPPAETVSSFSLPPAEPSTTTSPLVFTTSTTPSQALIPTPTPSQSVGNGNNNNNNNNNGQPSARPENDNTKTSPGGDLLSLEPSSSTSLTIRWTQAVAIAVGVMSLHLL